MLIPRETLMKIVAPTASFVSGKVIPILENIVLSGKGEKISAYSSNGLYSVKAQANYPVEEEFNLLIPGEKFLGIIKALPKNTEVSIERKGAKVVVRHNRSRFTLNLSNQEDYPSHEDVEHFPARQFPINALKFASSSMPQKDVRPYLNGVLLRPIGKDIDFVATNGHRLSRQTVAGVESDVQLFNESDAIIPFDTVGAVLKLFNSLEPKVSMSQGVHRFVRFTAESDDMELMLRSSLIDADYVPYERVIPNNPYEIAINTQKFLNAIELVYSLRDAPPSSSGASDAVVINVDGATMRLEHKTLSQEVATTEIEIEESHPIEIALNVHYLLDALNSMKGEDEVVFSYDSSERAAKIESGNKTCIIMPMRL